MYITATHEALAALLTYIQLASPQAHSSTTLHALFGKELDCATRDVVTTCIPVSFLSTWGVVVLEKNKTKQKYKKEFSRVLSCQ